MAKNEPFQPADKTLTDSVMTRIHTGMKVYDRDGKDVGKVEDIYLGEVSGQAADRGEGAATAKSPPGAALPGRDPIPAVITTHVSNNSFPASIDVLNSEQDVPDVLRNRLLRLGFIRVEKGWLFGKHRYILPEQIANVEGDRVNLKASKDELIKV